jgi:hypothetical protein
VEWFILIIPISVLGSNNVRVSIFLCFPGGLIEQLRVGLEATGNSTLSVTFSEIIIELHFSYWHFGERVWLSPKVWLQVSLSESR